MDLDTLINSGFSNLAMFDEQYARYKKDASSVDPSWKNVFDQLDALPASASPPVPHSPSQPALIPEETSGLSVVYYPKVEIADTHDEWRIHNLIDAYRIYGHLWAQVNPLEETKQEEPHQLNLDVLGFSKHELPKPFPSCGLFTEEKVPLLDIINALKATYCHLIGIEYMGLRGLDFERWVQEKIEPHHFKAELTLDQKHALLQHLNKSELFESFLHTKFVGQKRFSLEGAETLIPMLAAAIDLGATLEIDEFVFGMAHRGRLNVLCNIFDKSYAEIFSEFEEGHVPASVEGSGDVKYHKGFYSEVKTVHGHQVKLTLTPNPSHLESVNPVVEGQVRARQILRGDEESKKKVIPILIHGDAAFSGQGVVYETLQLSQLQGYTTGGTLHFIINNQIGFTTLPRDARSTCYCTDIGKAFNIPILHVNAEDPEGCVYATQIAVEIRQKFHCDVFVELNCYRKYGHNEGDEPAFTQPLEYQIIRKKQPIRDLYRDMLIQQSLLEKKMAETLEVEFKDALHHALETKAETSQSQNEEKPSKSKENKRAPHSAKTGVAKETLQEIGSQMCRLPPSLTAHPKLVSLMKERHTMLQEGPNSRPLDWGMAELLAYGSLLWEGRHIRLTGQDCCRGTFSHRHALLMDQVKEEGYVPLQHLKGEQGHFTIYNSPLSEFAALGFEFGYSVADQQALVIWEAQFGDFANGGQVVIDQFIAPAEQKWGQHCSLTLFLPHGYEGQGPEHSSGRIERFLTLAGNNNMQIVNPTTPAQLFHLLRRQALSSVRKPLVVFTPKGLLRHPACISSLGQLTKGGFQEIIDDLQPPEKAERLILCSGRFYYDLMAEREKCKDQSTALVRIEQLYPFNIEQFKSILANYPSLRTCIWAQEEPSNMGAWSFLRPIFQSVLPPAVALTYVGRPRSAASAVGLHALHKQEHATIIHELFGTGETK